MAGSPTQGMFSSHNTNFVSYLNSTNYCVETSENVGQDNVASAVVLVTGGCGYVGTHTVFRLLEQNVQVVVVDNVAWTSDGTNNNSLFTKLLTKISHAKINKKKTLFKFLGIHSVDSKTVLPSVSHSCYKPDASNFDISETR